MSLDAQFCLDYYYLPQYLFLVFRMKTVKLILHNALSSNFALVLNLIFSKMLRKYMSTLHSKMIDSFFLFNT